MTWQQARSHTSAESFDSNVDDYTWSLNSKDLYFIGVWHATVNVYQTNLKGEVKQLTEGDHNYVASHSLVIRSCLLSVRASLKLMKSSL